MNYISLLLRTLGSGLDIIIIYYYYNLVFQESRYENSKTRLLCFTLFGFITIATEISSNSLMITIFSIILIILISFLFKDTNSKRFVSILILITLITLSEVITGMITALITNNNVDYLINNDLYYLQGMLISKTILFILIGIIHKLVFNYKAKTSRPLTIAFMTMPISTIFLIYIISDYAVEIRESRTIMSISLAVLFLIISNLLVFYIFDRQLKQEKKVHDTELVRQHFEYKADYYKQLLDKQRVSNKAVHDTKNQLYAISSYLNSNQILLAKEKIDALCSDAFSNIYFNRTGNDAIDALLRAKQSIIEREEIILKTSIFMDNSNEIDDIELCIVIGNLLDNSIEACLKIPEENEKEININIKQVDDYLSIKSSNTTAENVRIINGNIVTTKKDKALHGYGINSIKEIVKKHSGHINFEQIDNYFFVTIYIKNSISSPILQI